MKKISLFLPFHFCDGFNNHAQEGFANSRRGSCASWLIAKLSDERLTFQDILERARQLEFNENAPDAMFLQTTCLCKS